MALKPFRDELLAIMSTYRPFHDDFKSVHAVVEAVDEMMERLVGDRDAFWRNH